MRRTAGGGGTTDWTPILYFASQAAYGLATSIFDMVYPLHLLGIGIGTDRIGSIFLIGFITMAVVVVPVGFLADRLGQTAAMWLSSLGFGGLMLVFPFLRSYGSHLVAFALVSACSAVMLATVAAVVARRTPNEQRRFRLFRGGYIAFLVSSGMGAVLGGWLVSAFPHGITRYQEALIAAGGFGVIIGVTRIALALAEGAQPGAASAPAARPAGEALEAAASRLERGPVAAIILLAAFVGGFSVLAIRFLNIILVDDLRVSVVLMGYILALDRTVSIIGIFVLSRLIRRGSELLAGGLLMLAVVPAQLGMSLAASALAFLIPYLVRQGFYYTQMPILDLVTNRYAVDRSRALVNSLQRLGLFVGSGLAAQAYGILLAQGRLSATMLLSGALGGLAGIVYLTGFRRAPVAGRLPRRDAQEASAG